MRSLLDSNAKLVLSALVNINRNGKCNPGREFIGKSTGLSIDQVKRSIARLTKLGLISVRQGRYCNHYLITSPDRWGELLQPGDSAPAGGAKSPGCNNSSLYEEAYLKKKGKAAAISTASTNGASQLPNAAAAKKPPEAATVDWTASSYSMEEIIDWRLMLNYHGRMCRLPPVDDAMMKRLMDLTGKSAPDVHQVLKGLQDRGRLREVRSWGLFPLVLEAWFKSRAG